MKFNDFVWRLYRQSERGKKAVRRFSRLTTSCIEPSLRTYCFEFFDEFKSQYPTGEVSIDIAKLVRDSTSGVTFKSGTRASRHYRGVLVKKGIPFEMADNRGRTNVVFTFGDEDEDWYDYVSAVSLGLYQAQPDFFLPYNFRSKFNELAEICDEFDIPLPPVPSKNDKSGRALYYLAVNEAWQEFRRRHDLSPSEMCAFLYDFAPEFTTPLDASDLPAPSKAWSITGGKWDIEFADNATGATVSRWGGNSAVRRGDILVMYLVSPRSCLHSVWRACCDGFVDPFFHYHSVVWISGQVKTKPVALAELKQHPLLSAKPAVRCSFQGPNSKGPWTVEEYDALLEIVKSKGQDISMLPRLPKATDLPTVELLVERDVELHLIEPFLKRLGYKKSDWVRNMCIRMGRGERNYPDYAFGANTTRGEESAKMILESKYQLSAHHEFVDSFYQAKSYALRLQAKIMVMAAKEGIWVFPPDKGRFEIGSFIHKSWGELNNPDSFHQILCLIGRETVLGR